MGIHGPHRQEGRRPVDEEEGPGIPGEEMGRREDPLVAQQVQEAPDPVGGEEKELRRDDTLRVRVDNLASGRTLREVIISGLALSPRA